MTAQEELSCGKKVVRGNIGLPQNRAEGPFRQVPRVIGDSAVALGAGVIPDLVAAGRLAVELKAIFLSRLTTWRYVCPASLPISCL